MTYSEKLKDPRWQRKRLEVLNRDQFKCKLCDDDKTELQIHHLKYKGEPWDAPLYCLETLCKDCHSIKTYGSFGEIIKVVKFIDSLNGFILTNEVKNNEHLVGNYIYKNGSITSFNGFYINGSAYKTIINFGKNG